MYVLGRFCRREQLADRVQKYSVYKGCCFGTTAVKNMPWSAGENILAGCVPKYAVFGGCYRRKIFNLEGHFKDLRFWNRCSQ
jgi:hypothetical protein